jgi:hypothetical protein
VDDELRLKEKLRAIEALFAGATTPGERDAARARERITARIADLSPEPPVVWQFTTDPWSHRLLLALARRYGLKPFRYPRQRHSTVMLRGPEKVLREVFVPEYQEMVATLRDHLSVVADRIIAEVLGGDHTEAAVVDEPRQLEPSTREPT